MCRHVNSSWVEKTQYFHEEHSKIINIDLNVEFCGRTTQPAMILLIRGVK